MQRRQSSFRLRDYHDAARRRLPPALFDFIEGGAEDERTIEQNRLALEQLTLVPRRLVDVSSRSIASSFLGQPRKTPLVIAPTGLNGLIWRDGDIALARAAAKEDVPFVVSTASNASMEDIARSGDGERWFQLYELSSDISSSLCRRAWNAGYKTLVLTVDVPIPGNRERDIKNGFAGTSIPLMTKASWAIRRPRWTLDMLRSARPTMGNIGSLEKNVETQAALLSRHFDSSFDLAALTRLRSLWRGKLLVKGVLRRDDAHLCMNSGADGVILSNHGGRQLDSCISPMKPLPHVSSDYPGCVGIDSGFRRGTDVVKALAMGASFVMLGRVVLYGLASEGEVGVRNVLRLVKDEIDATLGHLGCENLEQLSPSYIFDSPQLP